ncbi:MAG TPA: isoprenylcysteine carboxylmethyltransferase family protein [Rhizomicrobium sp.]|nr:isoprenylcysteine carboxylmethyltransferase family protein [Rhizomicrobium sp.]
MASRLFILFYGLVAYAIFLATFLYAIAFIGDLPVPKTIDSGPVTGWKTALAYDLPLLALFAAQHSIMARRGFKRLWTKIVPPAAERSTYVLASSAALIVLYWLWKPLPATVWNVTNPDAQSFLMALYFLGFTIVLVSTFLINHFELFGLHQIWANLRGQAVPEMKFQTPLFYRMVRHPLYLGFLIAFWSAPHMTQGRLLFAFGASGYIVLGMLLEERDLVAAFGKHYLDYRDRVPMILPFLKPSRKRD